MLNDEEKNSKKNYAHLLLASAEEVINRLNSVVKKRKSDVSEPKADSMEAMENGNAKHCKVKVDSRLSSEDPQMSAEGSADIISEPYSTRSAYKQLATRRYVHKVIC